MNDADVYRFRQFYIPERMMGGISRYIRRGIEPGDFLSAVIANDLAKAVDRADDENMANLPAFVGYFYNEAPSECWGSPEKMAAWLRRGVVEACASIGVLIERTT